MKNLNEMNSKELKELAKEMKVKNWWNLRKAELIEEIDKLQNASDEEKEKIEKEIEAENKLFYHYQNNWRKYGDVNNWTKFYEKYKAGKITLLEDQKEFPNVEENQEEPLVGEAINNPVEENKTIKPKRGALIEYDGRSKNICAWGEELGINPNTLYARIYTMGWSIEKAFTTLPRKK